MFARENIVFHYRHIRNAGTMGQNNLHNRTTSTEAVPECKAGKAEIGLGYRYYATRGNRGCKKGKIAIRTEGNDSITPRS